MIIKMMRKVMNMMIMIKMMMMIKRMIPLFLATSSFPGTWPSSLFNIALQLVMTMMKMVMIIFIYDNNETSCFYNDSDD